MIPGLEVVYIGDEGAMQVDLELTPEKLIKRSEELGEQDVPDPIVIARYYQPATTFTWFMIHYEKESRIMFCYASLFHDYNDELGYTSLDEIEAQQKSHPVFRIGDWVEKPLSEAKKEAGLS